METRASKGQSLSRQSPAQRSVMRRPAHEAERARAHRSCPATRPRPIRCSRRCHRSRKSGRPRNPRETFVRLSSCSGSQRSVAGRDFAMRCSPSRSKRHPSDSAPTLRIQRSRAPARNRSRVILQTLRNHPRPPDSRQRRFTVQGAVEVGLSKHGTLLARRTRNAPCAVPPDGN